MFFSAAIAACALLTGVSAAPGGLETLGDRLNSRQSSTPNGEGTNNGYFYRQVKCPFTNGTLN
jgi:hypothetical protein